MILLEKSRNFNNLDPALPIVVVVQREQTFPFPRVVVPRYHYYTPKNVCIHAFLAFT